MRNRLRFSCLRCCRREDRDGAKKRYGNRGGADIESDPGFHSALSVPSENCAARGKESDKISGGDRGLDSGKTDSEDNNAAASF